MSKTKRRPFLGIGARSDKKDKVRYHKGRRKYEKNLVKQGKEDLIEPEVKDGGWLFAKDGKTRRLPKANKKYTEYEVKIGKETKELKPKDPYNYLTPKEVEMMTLDDCLLQLTIGLETCKTKRDAMELLMDAVQLGKEGKE